jgi:hypothetical protein
MERITRGTAKERCNIQGRGATPTTFLLLLTTAVVGVAGEGCDEFCKRCHPDGALNVCTGPCELTHFYRTPNCLPQLGDGAECVGGSCTDGGDQCKSGYYDGNGNYCCKDAEHASNCHDCGPGTGVPKIDECTSTSPPPPPHFQPSPPPTSKPYQLLRFAS